MKRFEIRLEASKLEGLHTLAEHRRITAHTIAVLAVEHVLEKGLDFLDSLLTKKKD